MAKLPTLEEMVREVAIKVGLSIAYGWREKRNEHK